MEIMVMSVEVWPDVQPKSVAIALHTPCDLTGNQRGNTFTEK